MKLLSASGTQVYYTNLKRQNTYFTLFKTYLITDNYKYALTMNILFFLLSNNFLKDLHFSTTYTGMTYTIIDFRTRITSTKLLIYYSKLTILHL